MGVDALTLEREEHGIEIVGKQALKEASNDHT